MSVKPSHCRVLIRMVLALAFVAACNVRMNAQLVIDSCNCPPQEEVTKRITICYEGQNQTVDVTYCNREYCPPVILAVYCNIGSSIVPIDAHTRITRICPVGFAPTNAKALMQGTIAAMSYCCGNNADLWQCPLAPYLFKIWIVRWPRCMYFDAAGCLNPCIGARCCGVRVRLWPNRPVAGQCETVIDDQCSNEVDPCPEQPVGINCIDMGCEYQIPCCQ